MIVLRVMINRFYPLLIFIISDFYITGLQKKYIEKIKIIIINIIRFLHEVLNILF